MSHDQATGSVVVVMGALSGIGEATALAFAQRGDVLVISGRHDDSGERLARYLKSGGSRRRDRAPRRHSGHLIMYSMTATLSGLYVDYFTLGQGLLRMMADIHEVTVTDHSLPASETMP